MGLQKKVYIGNLDSYRDWGHAKDYVKAQWLIMQQKEPDDFVIATGKQHSVRELCELAFREAGIDIEWRGNGLAEKGIVASAPGNLKHVFPGNVVVEVDPNYFRPTEVENLIGNPEKAEKILGWKHEIEFHDLVSEMVQEDLKIAQRDKIWRENGYSIRNNSAI
jgi:GDPmannose 4,6-dehydratase